MKVDLTASDLRLLIDELSKFASWPGLARRQAQLHRQLELAIADEHGCSIQLNVQMILDADPDVVYQRTGYCQRCGCIITADEDLLLDRYSMTSQGGGCDDAECLCHVTFPCTWYTTQEWADAEWADA